MGFKKQRSPFVLERETEGPAVFTVRVTLDPQDKHIAVRLKTGGVVEKVSLLKADDAGEEEFGSISLAGTRDPLILLRVPRGLVTLLIRFEAAKTTRPTIEIRPINRADAYTAWMKRVRYSFGKLGAINRLFRGADTTLFVLLAKSKKVVHRKRPTSAVAYANWLRDRADEQSIVFDMRESIEIDLHVVLDCRKSSLPDVKACLLSLVKQKNKVFTTHIIAEGAEVERIGSMVSALFGDDHRVRVASVELSLETIIADGAGRAEPWVLRLSPKDRLYPETVTMIIEAASRCETTTLIYFDDDYQDQKQRRSRPAFKPAWSPDFLESMNYIGETYAVQAKAAVTIGGWTGSAAAADWSFLLAFSRLCPREEALHLPRILSWRTLGKPGRTHRLDENEGLSLLSSHLQARSLALQPALVGWERERPTYKLEGQLSDTPLVSIVIPTKNNFALIRTCISSLLAKTEYPNIEIVVVDNGSTDAMTLDYLNSARQDARVQVITHDVPFNFSRICNFGAQHAKGSMIVFLNDDIEIVDGAWLTEMVRYGLMQHVGIVGAKLLYPDRRVQHAGVVVGLGGVAGHGHKFESSTAPGYLARLSVVSNFSALTAACVLIRRDVFEEAEGFDTEFAVAYNDVDFCLRIAQLGYLNVFNPHAVLVHHESASRGVDDTIEKMRRARSEMDLMQVRWATDTIYDPFYSPHLTYSHEDFSVRNHSLENIHPPRWFASARGPEVRMNAISFTQAQNDHQSGT